MKKLLLVLCLFHGFLGLSDPLRTVPPQDWRRVNGTNYNVGMLDPSFYYAPGRAVLPGWEKITGKVSRVETDGLVISRGNERLFLKNFPRQTSVCEGDKITCWAMRTDRKEIAGRVLKQFDHGTPVSAVRAPTNSPAAKQ